MSNIPTDFPLQAPPANETSNFHALDLQPAVIGVNAAFLSLMLVVLALRLYIRGLVIRSLWWEDYMAVLAALVIIARSVLLFTVLDVGYGRHAWNVRLRDVLSGNTLRHLSAIAIPGHLGFLFIKLSVAFLYWRIFQVTGKKFRWATIFIMVFCVVFYSGNFIYGAVQAGLCSNVTVEASNPNCGVGTQIITWVGAIGNVVSDLYLLILPIPPLARLKMGRARKVGIYIVFSAGGLATAASVTRLGITVAQEGSDDFLYTAAVSSIPTTIELCLGVVAASIPTLGKMQESPAVQRFASAVRSYASTLSLVRRSAASDSDSSVQLSVRHPNKDNRTPSAST